MILDLFYFLFTNLSVLFVAIPVAPLCTFSETKKIYVVLGDGVSVPCPLAAYPHDVTVTWVRRSTNQTLGQKTSINWSDDDVIQNTLLIIPG